MPPPPPQPHAPNAYLNTILNNPSSNPSSPSPLRSRRPADPPHHPFTSTQRSAQARSKDWSTGPSSTAARDPKRKHGALPETYEQRQLRDEAAYILDSSELLIWYAAARHESIPQTRRHYQNVLLGLLNTDEVVWREEWEVETETQGPGVGSPARSGKGKERDKGKKRVSSGHSLG
ncbi:hypothetical protein ACN47E_007863 [Coniothyrium glycines]